MATDPCHIYAYDYAHLSTMTFKGALEYKKNRPRPAQVSCLSDSSARMMYGMDGTSIVPEVSCNSFYKCNNLSMNTIFTIFQWNLVCENSFWRTIVQTVVSAGKCLGALSVGILSDKYGRKMLFGSGVVLYMAASILVALTPWYWAFLVGRMLLGLAAAGMFYPSMIMSKWCSYLGRKT